MRVILFTFEYVIKKSYEKTMYLALENNCFRLLVKLRYINAVVTPLTNVILFVTATLTEGVLLASSRAIKTKAVNDLSPAVEPPYWKINGVIIYPV